MEKDLLNLIPLSKKMLACMRLQSNSSHIRWYIRLILLRRFLRKNTFQIVIGTMLMISVAYLFTHNWYLELKELQKFFLYIISFSSIIFIWGVLKAQIMEYLSSVIVKGTKEQVYMGMLHRLVIKSLAYGQPVAFVYRNLMAIDPEEFGEWVIRINNTQRHHCVAVTSFDKMTLKNKLADIFTNSEFRSLDEACRHFTDIEIYADYKADITSDYDYMHKLLPELSKKLQFNNISIVSREKIIGIINHVLQSWHVFYYSYEDINYVIYNVQLGAYVFTMTVEQTEILVLRYLFMIAAPELTNSKELLEAYIQSHFDENIRNKVYQLVMDEDIIAVSLNHLHQMS